MDQITKSKLIQVLKSNGLLSKFEKEVEKLRVKRDSYFDWAEAIYAISRIVPGITDETLRLKFTNVNKIWVKMVITDDAQPQLRPFFERHGQEAVYNAVSYLLDKNAWVSPVDDKGLKAKMPSNFDGLKDIDETVALLKEEEEYKKGKKSQNEEVKQETPKGQDKTEESEFAPESPEPEANEHAIQFDIEAMKKHREEHNDARAAYAELGEMLAKAQVLHATFGNLTEKDEWISMLEQELKKTEKELQEHKNMLQGMKRMKDDADDKWRKNYDRLYEEHCAEIEKNEKELQKKKDTINTLHSELERERRLHKEDNDRAYQQRLAKEKAERELAEFRLKNEHMAASLEKFRQKEKDASETPAFKIIPLEELRGLYGVGAKFLSLFLPFMERHGVKFLDEDERRKMKRQQR